MTYLGAVLSREEIAPADALGWASRACCCCMNGARWPIVKELLLLLCLRLHLLRSVPVVLAVLDENDTLSTTDQRHHPWKHPFFLASTNLLRRHWLVD